LQGASQRRRPTSAHHHGFPNHPAARTAAPGGAAGDAAAPAAPALPRSQVAAPVKVAAAGAAAATPTPVQPVKAVPPPSQTAGPAVPASRPGAVAATPPKAAAAATAATKPVAPAAAAAAATPVAPTGGRAPAAASVSEDAALVSPFTCPGLSGGACGLDCQRTTCEALSAFFRATFNATKPWTRARPTWEVVMREPCSRLVPAAASPATPPAYCKRVPRWGSGGGGRSALARHVGGADACGHRYRRRPVRLQRQRIACRMPLADGPPPHTETRALQRGFLHAKSQAHAPAHGTPLAHRWYGVTCCSTGGMASRRCSALHSATGVVLKADNVNGSLSDLAFMDAVEQLHACGLTVLDLESNDIGGRLLPRWGRFSQLTVFNIGGAAPRLGMRWEGVGEGPGSSRGMGQPASPRAMYADRVWFGVFCILYPQFSCLEITPPCPLPATSLPSEQLAVGHHPAGAVPPHQPDLPRPRHKLPPGGDGGAVVAAAPRAALGSAGGLPLWAS
jgi:hypothetical protein